MNFMLPLVADMQVPNSPIPVEIEQAFRTIIEWAGDDPSREGLLETPARAARAWREHCAGYAENPSHHLTRTFDEVGGYDDIVLLREIPFQSHCEHHLAPIKGTASIAYLPGRTVVGISKIARVVQGFAHRLQIQERLTAEIADCLWDGLAPRGVVVVIVAEHGCMTGRGVKATGTAMLTSRMLGCFREDPTARREVMALMGR